MFIRLVVDWGGAEFTQVIVMLVLVVLDGCGLVVDVVKVVVVVVSGACWLTIVEFDEVADAAGEIDRFVCRGFTISFGLHLGHCDGD